MGHISIAEVMGSLNVIKTCLVENYNDKWIIDSRIINHVCYSLEWFKQSRPLRKRQKSLKFENREYDCNRSRTSGVMVKNFTSTKPFIGFEFKRNLVSVSCLWNMV